MTVSPRPRVFVVDDEAAILLLMDRVLRAHDFEPMTFPSGSEALARIPTERPSLVLLDLNMPGMSGEEFIRALRTNCDATVPVLILSGERLCEEEVQEIGASGAIQKPFQMTALIDAIRTWTSPGPAPAGV